LKKNSFEDLKNVSMLTRCNVLAIFPESKQRKCVSQKITS
jgi:hypothetical protein